MKTFDVYKACPFKALGPFFFFPTLGSPDPLSGRSSPAELAFVTNLLWRQLPSLKTRGHAVF